ncbi:nucleotidyltransferase family protein [Labilibacter marinus]|uniref:nucleotidyltransferase family protein n=1 Tax=Labilibacter marinus TaxID=1477105 RepID=UPI00082A4558|nr:nucleotidyltransferase family protein [Labilibacter marinus]
MTKASISVEHVKALISICRLQPLSSDELPSLSAGVVNLGVLHGVGGFCYKKIKESSEVCVDEASLTKWKQFYFQTSIKYQQKLKLYKLIKKLLEQEHIPVMALKGMALSSGLYSDEGTRPMGDMDILVPEGQGMRALEILLGAGAVSSGVPRSKLHEQVHSHVRAITMQGVMVEIHQRLFSLGSSFNEGAKDYFSQANELIKQDVDISILNTIYMGYHLVAHAAVGIEMGGLRLGWLLDIAILWSREQDKLAFMHAVIAFKKNREKALGQVFQMASLFLPQQDQNMHWDISADQIIQDITSVMKSSNIEEKHRWVNLKEVLRTPGLNNKLQLLYREFVPDADYMRYKYHLTANDSMTRLYLKRFFRV